MTSLHKRGISGKKGHREDILGSNVLVLRHTTLASIIPNCTPRELHEGLIWVTYREFRSLLQWCHMSPVSLSMNVSIGFI
jgi:hypothetical protein